MRHSLTFLHHSNVSSPDIMIKKGTRDHLKMTFSSMQNSSFSILRLFFFELKMLHEFFFVLSCTCSLQKMKGSSQARRIPINIMPNSVGSIPKEEARCDETVPYTALAPHIIAFTTPLSPSTYLHLILLPCGSTALTTGRGQPLLRSVEARGG